MASKALPSATGSQVAHLRNHSISLSTQKFRRPYSLIHYSRIRSLVIAAANDDNQVQFSKCHGHAVPLKLETDKQQYISTTSIAPTTPPVSMKQWNLTDQHLFVLCGIALTMGGAMTALFVSAIPTLLAFKRAAESLEKLLDVTREELPGTMAAVRLSGMEISDLTMELSELGQEISSGVRNSARAVRAAQDGLRRVSTVASLALLQDRRVVPVGSMKREVTLPIRGLHDKFTGMRMVFQSLVTLRRILGFVGRFWSWRRNRLLRQQ